MSRLARIFTLTMLLMGLGLTVIRAQEPLPPPQTTEQAPFPTVDAPLTPGVAAPGLESATVIATAVPTEAAPAIDVTAAPTATPQSLLGVEQTEALPILIAARADLELLATTAIGSGQRPLGWSGSIDVADPSLPLWIRLDLETLAGTILGAENRPDGWFGVVASIPLAVARDIRHDLELLADRVVGATGVRPAGWLGDDPIYRCSRATQSLLTLLKSRGIGIPVDFTQPDYCAAAEGAASRYVERQVLQPPVVSAGGVNVASQAGYPYNADSPFIVAFMDRKAQEKIGVLPVGTGFQPIARSYVDFSNMMLVSGDGFQVFVDYTTTSLTQQEFLALQDVGSGSGTFCNTYWCGVGLD